MLFEWKARQMGMRRFARGFYLRRFEGLGAIEYLKGRLGDAIAGTRAILQRYCVVWKKVLIASGERLYAGREAGREACTLRERRRLQRDGLEKLVALTHTRAWRSPGTVVNCGCGGFEGAGREREIGAIYTSGPLMYVYKRGGQRGHTFIIMRITQHLPTKER